MKYVVVLGDGMADRPLAELERKTPLEYAATPKMDELAKKSEIGLVHTIPKGMSPGSDTANLSVLGYDPKVYYTGRSPLEALSIGVDMRDADIALRCNMVTLSEGEEAYEEKVMVDHSSGELSTKEAAVLLEAVKAELESDLFAYYLGTSYRHLLIWDRGQRAELTPPHDILGRPVTDYLPAEGLLKDMMKKSYDILVNHPVNKARREKGLNPANSLWFWGAGTRPALASFEEKTGKRGAMISAVDLLKGIAVGAGMKNIEVEGADGTLHTNYEGKARAAVDALLKENDEFVYVHVEAPDEMGHQGSIDRKVKAIEYLDQRVIRPISEALDQAGISYRMLILPDHPTPISERTHTSDPVPYMLYDNTDEKNNTWCYNEREAMAGGHIITEGYKAIDYLFSK